MSWTDARVELLKTRWEEGASATEIAIELGFVTRSGVLGKVHRLGLTPRKIISSSPKPNRRPRVRSAARIQYINGLKGSPKPPTIIKLQEETSKNPVTLMGLNSENCHWPISGEGARMMFCGNPNNLRSSYCPYHYGISIGKPLKITDHGRDVHSAAFRKSTFPTCNVLAAISDDEEVQAA